MTVCAFCSRPVDPGNRSTWRRIVGWERKASAASRKSGSDITLREARDEFACPSCIDRLQNGVSPHQEALI